MKKNDKRLLLVGFVALIASIILLIAVLFYFRNKNTGDSISLEDASDEVVAELSDQLIYSSNKSENQYYSPELDIVFNYPTELLSPTNGYKSVALTYKDYTANYGLYSNLEIVENSSSESIETKYGSFNGYELTSENTEENINVYEFKYTLNSILKEDTKNTYYHKVYIIEKDEVFVSLDIKAKDNEQLLNKYSDVYIDLLNSVQTDTSNISQTATFLLNDDLLVGNFDRKTWQVDSQSNTWLTLGSIDEDILQYENISISTYVRNSEEPSKFIKDSAESQYKSNKKYYADKQFKIIDELSEYKTDNSLFYVYSYSYNNSSYKTLVKEYLGYEETTSSVISFRVTTNNDSFSDKELLKVLESIKPNTEKEASTENLLALNNSDTNSTYQPGNVLGTDTIELQPAAILGNQGVVHIFNRTCADVRAPSIDKVYKVCNAGLGTGFYVSADGYIVTNAHVSAANIDDILVDATYDPNGLFSDGLTQVLDLYPDANVYDPEVQQLLTLLTTSYIFDAVDEERLVIENITYENYIQLDKEFEVNQTDLTLLNPEDHLEAELIDHKEIDSTYRALIDSLENESEVELSSEPDLAILKVSDSDSTYPAIKLGDPDLLSTGTDIVVVGFPGSAENTSLFTNSASLIPTLTSGSISAIKPNTASTFDLIQIDASISHGNSGGPILNQNGELLAVATYGVSADSSADFNAGISVEEVISFLNKNGIDNETGEVTKLINSGLDNLAKEYYSLSIEDFNVAIELHSNANSSLKPLITYAQNKVDSGLDKSPLFSFSGIDIDKNGLSVIIIAFGFFMFVLAGNILLVIILLKRKSKPQQMYYVNQQPNNIQAPYPPGVQ